MHGQVSCDISAERHSSADFQPGSFINVVGTYLLLLWMEAIKPPSDDLFAKVMQR